MSKLFELKGYFESAVTVSGTNFYFESKMRLLSNKNNNLKVLLNFGEAVLQNMYIHTNILFKE